MGLDWRRPLAVALLAGILVVLGSAAWHAHPAPPSGDDDGSGTCPICLSQRSLDHCSIDAGVAVSAPPVTQAAQVPGLPPVAETPLRAFAARGPPLRLICRIRSVSD